MQLGLMWFGIGCIAFIALMIVVVYYRIRSSSQSSPSPSPSSSSYIEISADQSAEMPSVPPSLMSDKEGAMTNIPDSIDSFLESSIPVEELLIANTADDLRRLSDQLKQAATQQERDAILERFVRMTHPNGVPMQIKMAFARRIQRRP